MGKKDTTREELLATIRRLEESRRSYDALLSNLPGMVYRCFADEHWTMTFVSEGFTPLTGYQPEDLLHNRSITFNDVIHPEDKVRVHLTVEQALAQGLAFKLEYRIITADGKEKWVSEQGSAVPGTGDDSMELEGFITDISERKQAREEREQTDLQLRQSQKLEAVGRLAGGVAHDFNNLLTVITGHSDLMDLELRDDDPLKKSLLEIQRAAERAGRLTNQLLAFSRRQVLKPRIIDLNRVITEMEKMLRRLIGEDLDLVVRLEPKLSPIMADPGQIEQVVMNLAVNARDAMAHGGQLTIETRLEKQGMVTLAVSDTGVGMDEETRLKIFEPFFTTKREGKGTGLGLSTVYGIVTQSNGEISVESEPGMGATFRMEFPASEGMVEDVLPRISVDLEKARAAETILVLEDNDAVRELAVRVLERCGYTVLEANGGSEARRIAAGHDGPIHLLLTDVILPGESGPEAAGKLSTQRPEMKVLYMSGYTDEVIVDRGAEPGLDEILEKPFSPQRLAHMVRNRLAG